MKVADLQKTRSRKDQYPLNKVRDLAKKRERKTNDYLHKASKLIVDRALSLKVNRIII
jgi:transposase